MHVLSRLIYEAEIDNFAFNIRGHDTKQVPVFFGLFHRTVAKTIRELLADGTATVEEVQDLLDNPVFVQEYLL